MCVCVCAYTDNISTETHTQDKNIAIIPHMNQMCFHLGVERNLQAHSFVITALTKTVINTDEKCQGKLNSPLCKNGTSSQE